MQSDLGNQHVIGCGRRNGIHCNLLIAVEAAEDACCEIY